MERNIQYIILLADVHASREGKSTSVLPDNTWLGGVEYKTAFWLAIYQIQFNKKKFKELPPQFVPIWIAVLLHNISIHDGR